MAKKKDNLETVTISTEFNVPVSLDIRAYIDEDGNAQVTDVQVGHIQGLSVDRLNESLCEEDFVYLTELVKERLAAVGRKG